jgi:hypothetical protein
VKLICKKNFPENAAKIGFYLGDSNKKGRGFLKKKGVVGYVL